MNAMTETTKPPASSPSTASTASPLSANPAAWRDLIFEWWPVLVGLVVLYFPSFRDLANGLWQTDDQAHGPIILLVIGYLIWQNYEFLHKPVLSRAPFSGSVLFVFGLLVFALGRSQEILVFELGSMVPILAGIMLVSRGWAGLRVFWFPIFFCIFLIPLPGLLVDAATGPLKKHISEIAESVLYTVGYPIARDGITISIGPYQLLVADACSGLHSMFSLSALGVLYLHLMGYRNLLRNSLLVVSILPIAFAANVVRVMILILVTYHFGDEAGQGIIHGMAGMMLFVISLIFLFAFDFVIGKIKVFRDSPQTATTATTATTTAHGVR
jgi:exosortase B